MQTARGRWSLPAVGKPPVLAPLQITAAPMLAARVFRPENNRSSRGIAN